MGHHTDGRFELYYRQGWAYLVVHPPQEGGRPVYHEDVKNRMRVLGVPRVPGATVRAAVDRAAGTPERLVEWPGGERLASVITVGVAEDEMSAWTEVGAPRKGAAPPEVEDVLEALDRAGVVYGVDREAITSLLAHERYGERITVARGREPVDARSAEIIYHFDPHRGRPYMVMEFDRINLRELNFIENKHEGDLLAELVPPVEPHDGRTVRGVIVPAKTETRPISLAAGSNTELSPDGSQIHATATGNVRLDNGAVLIEPVVSVESVNYTTGNIRFEGSVVVEKDVADGFVIEADGDVQVGRGVGKASITAGGNVLLKAGMNGNGEGTIACEGNLFAKYIESTVVTCHQNAFVEEAIMHSRVTVWRHCVLNGRRSEIIASNIVVGGSLWCKKLGSVAEGPTYVSIGVDPELLGAFREAKRELEASETRFDDVQQQIQHIDHALVGGRTDDRLYAAREQLMDELNRLKEELPATRHRLHELRQNLEASKESRLVVEDTIFKGAVVLFGTREYHPPEKGARKTVLKRGPEGIEEAGFNPADRPTIPFAE